MRIAALFATTLALLSGAATAAPDCATMTANLGNACELQARASKAVLGAEFDLDEAEDDCAAVTAARTRACTALGNAPYVFPLRARDFQAVVDHPYLPLKLGRKLTYKEGAKTVTIEVLRQRRDLDGIPVTVVRDRSVEDGETDEDTLDFFAQKRDGTVVYLGEFTAVFESGIQAATSGSFLAGYASGFGYGEPLAGVTMPGNPKIAKSYRLEFDAGNAEEYYTTAGTCGTVVTPAGTFTDTIKILEYGILEPEARGEKCFARGVGLVRARDLVEGGTEILTKIEG